MCTAIESALQAPGGECRCQRADKLNNSAGVTETASGRLTMSLTNSCRIRAVLFAFMDE